MAERKIAYMKVTVDAYQLVINTMAQLSYAQVAQVFQKLQQETTPVFEDELGRIVPDVAEAPREGAE